MLFLLMPCTSRALGSGIAASSRTAKIPTPFGTRLEAVDDKTLIGWKLTVDGVGLSPKQFTLVNEQLGGQLVYGRNPASGRDQWAYHERGGGGSITLPFAILDDELYIAVVQQNRPLQSDGPALNTVRGFLDPGRTHFETAAAELSQELGLMAGPIELPGPGNNPNSAFFETRGGGEGVSFWAVPVPAGLLERTDDPLCRQPPAGLAPSTGQAADDFRPISVIIRPSRTTPCTPNKKQTGSKSKRNTRLLPCTGKKIAG